MKGNTGFLVILAGLALGALPGGQVWFGEGPAAAPCLAGAAAREFSTPDASGNKVFRVALRLLTPFRPARRVGTPGRITAALKSWRSPVQHEAAASPALGNRDAEQPQLRRWLQLEDIFQAARQAALNRTLHPSMASGNQAVRRSSRSPRIVRWVRFRPARPEPPAPPDTPFTKATAGTLESRE